MVRRGESGITLIEVAVVLALATLLTAAAYPLLGNILNVMRSKGASEQVGGAIRQARQYAITKGALHCIQFSGSPTTYTIKTASAIYTSGCDGTPALASELVANGYAVTWPSPAPTLIFDPIGNSYDPATSTTAPSLAAFNVDTSPTSCLSTVTVTIYGGVRVSKC